MDMFEAGFLRIVIPAKDLSFPRKRESSRDEESNLLVNALFRNTVIRKGKLFPSRPVKTGT